MAALNSPDHAGCVVSPVGDRERLSRYAQCPQGVSIVCDERAIPDGVLLLGWKLHYTGREERHAFTRSIGAHVQHFCCTAQPCLNLAGCLFPSCQKDPDREGRIRGVNKLVPVVIDAPYVRWILVHSDR